MGRLILIAAVVIGLVECHGKSVGQPIAGDYEIDIKAVEAQVPPDERGGEGGQALKMLAFIDFKLALRPDQTFSFTATQDDLMDKAYYDNESIEDAKRNYREEMAIGHWHSDGQQIALTIEKKNMRGPESQWTCVMKSDGLHLNMGDGGDLIFKKAAESGDPIASR